MDRIRVAGIPQSVADAVRATMRAPDYGHPAHRARASGYGPCRLCLRRFLIGAEERILFTYNPSSEPDGLPAPGPVFIHAEACARYDAAQLPPDFCKVPMVIEGYRGGGWLVTQEKVNGTPPEEVIAGVLAMRGVNYVRIRNAEAGCFMARVDRFSD
jgi:hypothetical protein